MKLVDNEPPVPPAQVNPEDVHVLIYTSGTTGLQLFILLCVHVSFKQKTLIGKPKGVVLSNQNISSVVKGSYELWQDHLVQQRSLAFLPWAHVYGQVNEMDSFIACGSCLGIVSNRSVSTLWYSF
jgi:long-chain acyl-CoA synthetase